MAIDIAFRADLDVGEGAKSIKTLKQEYKDAQKELDGLTVGTSAYVKQLEKLGKIKDDIGDLNDEIAAFNPEGKVQAFSKVIGGLASGFQAAQGAMALFGNESEELQKTLLKVQAATAFAEGIKGVMGMKDAFVVLGNVLKANPIMMIATVITAAATAFYGIYRAITQTSDATDTLNKQLEVQKKITEATSRETKRQIELLTAQGASEREIIAAKEILINAEIAQLEISLKQHTSKLRDIKDNDSLWESTLRVSAAIQSKIGDEDLANKQLALIQINKQERAKEDLEAIAKEKEDLKDLRNQINMLAAEKVNIGKKEVEDHLKILNEKKQNEYKYRDEVHKMELEARDRQAQLLRDIRAQEAEINRQAQDEKFAQMDAETAKFFEESAKRKETLAADKEHEREQINRSLEIGQKSTEALIGLSELYFNAKRNNLKKGSAEELKAAKKQFEINKSLSLVSASISGVQAVINAYSSGAAVPVYGVVLGPLYAGIAALAAFSNIQKIQNSSFEGGVSGGSGSLASTSASAPSVSTPTINAPNTSGTQLNPDGTVKQAEGTQTPTVRAVVVETDMTSTQKRVSNIETNAKI